MELEDVLDDRIIHVGMHAKDKHDALVQLSNKLEEAGYISDVEAFIEDIYLREKEGMTGIGNHVAIPHGKSDYVSNVGVAIGKFEEDIEWETFDDKGVRLIFLFAVSNDVEYAKNHLLILSKIAGKLGNDDAIERLLKAKTSEAIKEVFI